MTHSIMIYILITAIVSYMIRVLPLTLIRKPIKNIFVQSFLYYVPYVTIAVMTFPAIIMVTKTPISGLAALVTGVYLSLNNKSLITVAACCCLIVLLLEFFI